MWPSAIDLIDRLNHLVAIDLHITYAVSNHRLLRNRYILRLQPVAMVGNNKIAVIYIHICIYVTFILLLFYFQFLLIRICIYASISFTNA